MRMRIVGDNRKKNPYNIQQLLRLCCGSGPVANFVIAVLAGDTRIADPFFEATTSREL